MNGKGRRKRGRVVWKGVDPRGRHVRLSRETLVIHIEPGHSEVKANLDLIGLTVSDPDRIPASGTKFPNREIYERLDDVKGYAARRRYYWVVVVEWRRPGRAWRGGALLGAIITKYASRKPRKGTVTWVRSGSSP